MEDHQVEAFKKAAKFTADSIENCQLLASFIKKRQIIEEEYARSLRKLCKSVSLTPLQMNLSSGNRGGRKFPTFLWPLNVIFNKNKKKSTTVMVNKDEEEQSSDEGVIDGEDITKTSLWSTFYEIIDDTSQVAKSHTAFAESLQHQLSDPLKATIKEMSLGRKQLIDEGMMLLRELNDSEKALKKSRNKFDHSNKKAVNTRAALEHLQCHRQEIPNASQEIEKLHGKTRSAEDKFVRARMEFRQQEESLRSLQHKFYTLDLPTMMMKLQQQEIQRSREALSYILGLIELERRCAMMNENYANEMGSKLKRINLLEDERSYDGTFMNISPIITAFASSGGGGTSMPMVIVPISTKNNMTNVNGTTAATGIVMNSIIPNPSPNSSSIPFQKEPFPSSGGAGVMSQHHLLKSISPSTTAAIRPSTPLPSAFMHNTANGTGMSTAMLMDVPRAMTTAAAAVSIPPILPPAYESAEIDLEHSHHHLPTTVGITQMFVSTDSLNGELASIIQQSPTVNTVPYPRTESNILENLYGGSHSRQRTLELPSSQP